MDLQLKGRRALVLGASRGLGAAIATALAAEGVTVLAAARDTGAIAALDDGSASGGIEARSLDLSDPASVAALVAEIAADGVDIIVNNSGGPPPGPAATLDADVLSRQFDTMVTPLIRLTEAALDGMAARGFGRVVTLTSSGLEAPIARLAISNTLRPALLGWSKTLAAEVAPKGITVNVIVQGRIHTDRVDQLDAAAAERTGRSVEEVRKASLSTIPMGRYGHPEELANAVLFLCSPRASYITGAKLRVDGGMIASV